VTPERWAEVKAVVAGALESPIADREHYLASVCRDDHELREEAESLLATADSGDSLPGARAAVSAARESFVTESDSVLRAAIERALGTQYEIVRRIAEGGMGAVYLARDRALERLVAVKVLRPDLAEAQESRERFRREARTAAQLSHPGIVPLHSFGEIDGIWYFVMGYVRGQSLAERLHLEGSLPPGDVRRILIELADALEWAHRHGVIHRDIKPANVLLDDESGRTILSDFGISKVKDAVDGLTETGAVVGTPHFMSPEQGIGSSDLDERSDIYSLGAVGYAMLAGREPFAGVSSPDLLYRRLSHAPVPVQTLVPSAPEDLAAVVMRCLAPDRTARWPSAWELREALGRTSGASAPTLPEPVRDLPSFGPYALLWAVAWSMLAFIAVPWEASGRSSARGVSRPGWPAAARLEHRSTRARAARARRAVASWPPEWWGCGGRARSAPDRLLDAPAVAGRLVRIVLSAFLLVVPAVVLTRQWLRCSASESSRGPCTISSARRKRCSFSDDRGGDD
jgi:serine/threonine-protein kinase